MTQFVEHEIEWDDEKIRRLWDYYSRTYPYNQNYFTKIYGKYLLMKTKKIVGSLNNKVILDYGCGPGFLIEHMKFLKIKPKKYIGLDFSERSIQCVLQNKAEFPIDAIFVKSLPSTLEDNSIDICFLIEVIEHLNDNYLNSTMQEIYRVLKLGGKLIITTPNKEDLNLSKNFCPECGCIYHSVQHVRVWDKTTLEKTMSNYGLKKIKIAELNMVPKKSILQELYIQIRFFFKKQKANLFGIFYK